jgi:hypothetical protein
MVASAVPSPAENVSPVVPASDAVPLVAVSVTVTEVASMSLTEIALLFPAEKTRFVSSSTACAEGTALTGASLTASTVRVNVWELASIPPFAVPPLSWTVTVNCDEPDWFAARV